MVSTLLSLFSVSLFAVRSLAAPIVEDKRAIDSKLLDTFNLMGQYAAAAYCSSNYDSTGDKLTCSAQNCPMVQAADTTTMMEYASQLSTDVTGYVATDATNRLIIVSFRGSASIENWITDFRFNTVDTGLCSNCTAHAGFWQSWLDAKKDVSAAVKSAKAAHPDYQIVSTGHSLGGAVATLAAAQLRKDGYNVALYSFGSPRVAGATLSDFITKQPGGNYRITHLNDPVPRVPLLIMNYVHISPEYYINKKNQVTVGSGDITVIQGSVNLLKGNEAHLVTDFAAHGWYFNAIATCLVGGLLGRDAQTIAV